MPNTWLTSVIAFHFLQYTRVLAQVTSFTSYTRVLAQVTSFTSYTRVLAGHDSCRINMFLLLGRQVFIILLQLEFAM